MVSSTRTRYARAGDVDIAYQVLGEGPLDLILFTQGNIPIECMDEEPSMARFQRRLASFSRILRFDRRGVGLSDRGSPASPPTPEEWAEDALAVIEAVGSERVAVMAPYNASPEGIVLAASHPERVHRLVIVNGFARTAWAPDYPYGLPDGVAEMLRTATESEAVELGVDILAHLAPSVAGDAAFRAWWDRAGTLGATPGMARAMQLALLEVDVRCYLPQIRVPTLVLQRADATLGIGRSRYLVEHIPGSRIVELPGADRLYWVGDTASMLDEIEEFLTGVRGGSGVERVLATVLFTDIVGSTDRAAQLGDGRWRDLLERHDRMVRQQLLRFGGREVDTAGDGFLVTFDSPSRAIECARAISESLKMLGIDVRAGIHTGEVELRGDDVAGLAVHIGARVSGLAGPGELLVSAAVPPLVAGSGIEFTDRGEHHLKGVPGSWRLYAVER